MRNHHAGSDADIHAAVVKEDVAHALVTIGPVETEGITRFLAGLEHAAGARLPPRAAVFGIRCGLGVNEHGVLFAPVSVVHAAGRKEFQMRAGLRQQNEEAAASFYRQPIQKGPVPGDECMFEDPAHESLLVVPHVTRVHR